MFGEFSGIRKYRVLSLGQEDMTKMQELYPIEQRCKDMSIFCQKKGADAVCQVCAILLLKSSATHYLLEPEL